MSNNTRRTVARSIAGAVAQKMGSKIGMSTIGNPMVAKAPEPTAKVGEGQNRTQAFTYFTKVGPTEILYSGDRLWAKVTLTLETAGPVAVGTVQNLTPVLSGVGQLLETDDPTPFTIAKGVRLYIASTSVNRIKVTVEPLPWMEQITALLSDLVGRFIK